MARTPATAPAADLPGSGPGLSALNRGAALMILSTSILLWLPTTRLWAQWFCRDEKGPVEVGTFLAFLGGACVSGWLARQARARDPRPLVRVYFWLFAGFCLFAALEEISYGQSFFDIQTPDWLRHLNQQGETNLHNLPGIMDLNSAFVMLFGLVGALGTWLDRSPRFRPFATPRGLVPLFAMIAGMGALETFNDFTILNQRWAHLIGIESEVVELLGAIASLVYVVLLARALRREWSAQDKLEASRLERPAA